MNKIQAYKKTRGNMKEPRLANIRNSGIALLISTTVLLNGCAIVSPKVFNIGLRETYGELPENPQKSGTALFNDSPLKSVGMYSVIHEKEGYIPGNNCCHSSHPVPLGQLPYEIIEMPSSTGDWDGKALVDIKGEKTIFQVKGFQELTYPKNYSLRHQYRQWYGYPAQVLQIGAVPIDIGADVGIVIGGAIYYLVAIGEGITEPITKRFSHHPVEAASVQPTAGKTESR